MFLDDDLREPKLILVKLSKQFGKYLCWSKDLNGIASIEPTKKDAIDKFCKDAEECYGDKYQMIFALPMKPIVVPSWDPQKTYLH